MAARILAVLAAALLVVTFALATLGSFDITLGHGLMIMNRDLLETLQPTSTVGVWRWVWDHIVVPFLVRPVWLLPAALGLLCAGGAATVASYGTHRSHRRRS